MRRTHLSSVLPPAIAGIVLLVGISVLLALSERHTRGHYIYPLDDTYIHIAMAKNLALHGVWGTSKYHFGSLSSSPLWTLILAGVFKMAGVGELPPLIICIILSVLCLIVADRIARREGMSPWARTILLLAIVCGAPLPTLSLLGMEHVLQILVDMIFLYAAATSVGGRVPVRARELAWLAFLAAVVCMTRYEGLFLVGAGAVALLVGRRWVGAMFSLAGGILPIAILGMYSVRHGGLWLPNSVLLKGHSISFGTLNDAALAVGQQAFDTLTNAPWLLAPLVLAMILLIFSLFVKKRSDHRANVSRAMLLITIIATVLHAQFADTGHFFRYESYLIVLLLLAIMLALSSNFAGFAGVRSGRAWIGFSCAAGAFAVVLVPICGRSATACTLTPCACMNIWQQQCQFANFLHRYYEGQGVAINDIGAADFFSDIRSLDIYGLDDPEIGTLRYRDEIGPNTIAQIARKRGVKIAVVYERWVEQFNHRKPPWIKVATWKIDHNVICSDDTIAFYAVDPAERDNLIRHLEEFNAELPDTVTTSIFDESAVSSAAPR